MEQHAIVMEVLRHHTYRALSIVANPRHRVDDEDEARDLGAVSLEQVLWFVAAGVSVAVIAGILWTQIRNEAETPVQTPTSP